MTKMIAKPMLKSTILLLSVFLLCKATWASPFSENVLPAKPQPTTTLKELEGVLFPTRLDGVSALPSFRISPKKNSSKEHLNLYGNTGDFLSPNFISEAEKRNFMSKSSQYKLPYNLYLESRYTALEHTGPTQLQEPTEFLKVLRTSSLGITYPLTSRLTLDGRYAVVKGENLESLSPLLGGTYRLNAATSISVSYPDLRPEDQHTVTATSAQQSHPSAELKIHF